MSYYKYMSEPATVIDIEEPSRAVRVKWPGKQDGWRLSDP